MAVSPTDREIASTVKPSRNDIPLGDSIVSDEKGLHGSRPGPVVVEAEGKFYIG